MKIAGMRRFVKNPRLQADSVPDITRPFEDAVLELSRSLTFAGGKLRGGHVLNALIHAFNQMDGEERLEAAATAVARLEMLLAEEDEERRQAEKRLEELGAASKKVVRTRVHDDQPSVKPKRSKKSVKRSGDDVGAEDDETPTVVR